MTVDRRAFLKGTGLIGLATGLGSAASVLASRTPAFAANDPTLEGSWSAQIPLGIVGIHAAVLHTGKVLYYTFAGSSIGSRARLYDPVSGVIDSVDIPYVRDVFCSGLSFLPDGRLLITGGEPDDKAADLGVGNPYITIFDPATNSWLPQQNMSFARWYPSNVVMPDGKTLIMGGQAAPGGQNFIKQMEIFDPGTLRVSQMPTSATKWMGLYPRVVLLANGQVLKAGKGVRTFRFDRSVPKWFFVDEMLGGVRKSGAIALLPGNLKALALGGRSADGTITATAEIIDFSSSNPQWRLVGRMSRARHNHSVVTLPDGTILVVGGGDAPQKWSAPVGLTELFDPVTETFRPMAVQPTNRTYHSTAVLLPDGRIASAGSNSKNPEQNTIEIYSPPYLFNGARPTISSLGSSTASWGGTLSISTPGAASIGNVVLMKPGANTHQQNFDQRRLVLPFTVGSNSVVAHLPSTAEANPPGYYMLFLLNTAGVPSVAPFVRIS